jgi:hypothetical protein
MAREELKLDVSVAGIEQIEKLSVSLRNLVTSSVGMTRRTQNMDAAQRALSQAVGVTNKGLNEHAKTIGQVRTNQRALGNELNNLRNAIKQTDARIKSLNTSFAEKEALRQFNNQLKTTERNLERIRPRALISDLRSLSVQFKKAGKDAQFVGRSLIIGLTTPIMMFANRGLDAFKAFDAELVRLKKILGEAFLGNEQKGFVALLDQEREVLEKLGYSLESVTSRMDAFNQVTFQMSQKFGVSRDLVTAVTADFAELGIASTDVLLGLADVTNQLSVLGSMDISQSQELLQTMFLGTMRSMDLMGREFSSALEKQEVALEAATNQLYLFNAIENNTALSFRDMADSIPEASSAATIFGLTMTQTAAMLAPMKAAGIDVKTAANGLKVALQRLATPTGVLQDTMAGLTARVGESGEELRAYFDEITGVGIHSIQSLVDATNLLRQETDDEAVIKFYAQLFEKRQATRMLTSIDSLIQFQKELNSTAIQPTGETLANILEGIAAKAGFASQGLMTTVRTIEDFTNITKVANAQVGESVGGVSEAVTQGQIDSAKKARQMFRDYVSDVEKNSEEGIQVVDQLSSQAGKALLVELLGAANAQQLAQEELDIALASTSKQIDRMRIAFKNIATDIISSAEPAIRAVSSAVVNAAEAISKLPTGIKQLMIVFAGAVAAIGPLVFIFGQVKLAAGVMGGVLFKMLPGVNALSAETLAATPGLLKMKNAITMQGDAFTTSAGRMQRFIASVSSGRGPIARMARAYGEATGVLSKQFTAPQDVLERVGMTSAAGEAALTNLDARINEIAGRVTGSMATGGQVAGNNIVEGATRAAAILSGVQVGGPAPQLPASRPARAASATRGMRGSGGVIPGFASMGAAQAVAGGTRSPLSAAAAFNTATRASGGAANAAATTVVSGFSQQFNAATVSAARSAAQSTANAAQNAAQTVVQAATTGAATGVQTAQRTSRLAGIAPSAGRGPRGTGVRGGFAQQFGAPSAPVPAPMPPRFNAAGQPMYGGDWRRAFAITQRNLANQFNATIEEIERFHLREVNGVERLIDQRGRLRSNQERDIFKREIGKTRQRYNALVSNTLQNVRDAQRARVAAESAVERDQASREEQYARRRQASADRARRASQVPEEELTRQRQENARREYLVQNRRERVAANQAREAANRAANEARANAQRVQNERRARITELRRRMDLQRVFDENARRAARVNYQNQQRAERVARSGRVQVLKERADFNARASILDRKGVTATSQIKELARTRGMPGPKRTVLDKSFMFRGQEITEAQAMSIGRGGFGGLRTRAGLAAGRLETRVTDTAKAGKERVSAVPGRAKAGALGMIGADTASKRIKDLNKEADLFGKRAPGAFTKARVRVSEFTKATFSSKGVFAKLGSIIASPFKGLNKILGVLSKIPFVGKIFQLISAFTKLSSILNILKGGMAIFAMAGIAAGIAVLLPLIKAVIDNFSLFKEKIEPGINALTATFKVLKDVGMALLSPFQDLFAALSGGSDAADQVGQVANVFNKLASFIFLASLKVQDFVEQYVVPFMKKAFGAFMTIVDGFKNIIRGAIGMKNGVAGAGDQMKEGLKKVGMGILQFFLGTLAPALINVFAAIAKGAFRVLLKLVENLPTIIAYIVQIFLELLPHALKVFRFIVVKGLTLLAHLPEGVGLILDKAINLFTDFVRMTIDALGPIAQFFAKVFGVNAVMSAYDAVGGALAAIGRGATSAAMAGVNALDGALGSLIETVSEIDTGGIVDFGKELSAKLGDAMSGAPGAFDGFIDAARDAATNALAGFVPEPVADRLASEMKDTVEEELGSEELYEPTIDAAGDAGESAGENFASKFNDALKDLKQKFVDLVGDYLTDQISEASSKLIDALETQRDAALKVFDDQLSVIEKLSQAEKSLMREREYIANRRKLLDERELNRQNYVRNRALAIYEGRIDDARMLDLEEQKSSQESAQSISDLENKRNEELRKENLEFLKNQIKEAKQEADDFFKSQIEAFKEAAKEITRFAPQTIQDYENQLNQLKSLATTFANQNGEQFASTFQKMQEKIEQDMPNKAISPFGIQLEDLIAVAREKYGLDDENAGVLGATVAMLTGIEGDITSNTGISESFDGLLENLKTNVVQIGLDEINQVIKDHDPAQTLLDAITFAQESILNEWRGTVGHVISVVDPLANMMDPMIANILEAQMAIENLAGAASGAGQAVNDALGTGGGAGGAGAGGGGAGAGGAGGGGGASVRRPPATLALEEIDAIRNWVRVNMAGFSQSVKNKIVDAIVSIESNFQTNRDSRLRGLIYSEVLAGIPEQLVKGQLGVYMSRMYPTITPSTGGGGSMGGPIRLANGGYVRKFGAGGYNVPGFGNQSIPALLHGGEFVMNSRAVSRIGMATLQAMNDMRFKSPGRMGQNQNVTTINKTENINIYVDTFIGEDKWFNEMMDQYNIKMKPINEKKRGGEVRVFDSYSYRAGR